MIVSASYYLSRDFYYPGDAGDPPEEIALLERALSRAELIIDTVTGGRCARPETLTIAARDRLRTAVCVQAEFMLKNGFDSAGGSSENIKVRIGDFSYESAGIASGSGGADYNDVAPAAMTMLMLSGIVAAGAEVR